MTFGPRHISFDCYGTLINCKPNDMARMIFADRIGAEHMPQFLADFTAYRLDEVLDPWQPFGDVIKNAVRRLARRWKFQYVDAEAQSICDVVPTRGPHPDATAGRRQGCPEERRTARRAVAPRLHRRTDAGLLPWPRPGHARVRLHRNRRCRWPGGVGRLAGDAGA